MRGALARGAVGSMGLMVGKNALQLGVAILLARILAPSGYGRYAFAMSLVGIVGLFVMLGLPGLLTREVAVGEARGEWSLVRGLVRRANQAMLIALAVVVPAGVALLLVWPHITWDFRLTLAFAFGFLAINAFVQLRSAEIMGLRHVIAGQVGTLCVQPGLLLAAVLVLVFAAGVPLTAARALFLAAAAALAVLVLNTLLVHRFRPAGLHAARPVYQTRYWLRSAIPFAMLSGLFLFNSQTDLVMLGFLTHSSEVGLYRVAASGAMLVPIVLVAVNPVLGPTLARLYALEDYAKLRRVVRAGALLSLLGAAPALIIYIALGKPILHVVFGADYVAAWVPLVILAGGQFVNAAMGPVGLVLNMTGHERDTVWVMAASALLNVALNGALIPFFGMTGAATATAASLVFWNLMLALRVRKRLGFVPVAFFYRAGMK